MRGTWTRRGVCKARLVSQRSPETPGRAGSSAWFLIHFKKHFVSRGSAGDGKKVSPYLRAARLCQTEHVVSFIHVEPEQDRTAGSCDRLLNLHLHHHFLIKGLYFLLLGHFSDSSQQCVWLPG